uniref:Uncharacterized protein n=1 Tax=Amphimedon queenslandica TaxID=400682 RepID=A0A1X7VFX3_AMPQE
MSELIFHHSTLKIVSLISTISLEKVAVLNILFLCTAMCHNTKSHSITMRHPEPEAATRLFL